MIETACQYGEQNRLCGVLTLPDDVTTPNTVFVLVSAGFTSSIGPFRLYTKLARELADQGIATFRFDLGGIGDSEQIDLGLPVSARTIVDIRTTLDYLAARFEHADFVLGGLCSGAEDSFRYADQDDRVTGLFLIDPHAYRTSGWQVRDRFGRYLFIRIAIRAVRILRKLRSMVARQDAPQESAYKPGLVDYQYMDLSESTAILKRLIRRRVRLHYLYTGGRIEYFNHRAQFYDMFPDVKFDGSEVITYLPNIEHVQVFEQDRDLVIRAARRWFENLSDRQTQSAV